MLGNSIYVQKRGEVYTVQLEPGGSPIPVATVDDEPIGAFPYTFNSRQELEAAFPGRNFVILENKPKHQTVIAFDPDIEKQALAVLKSPPPSAPTAPVNEHDYALPVGLSIAEQRAEEFLKRLQIALQYASKKHQKVPHIQVNTIRDFINEVFKR